MMMSQEAATTATTATATATAPVKQVPGFSKKRGGGYTGKVLGEDIKEMLQRQEQKKDTPSATKAVKPTLAKPKTAIKQKQTPAQTHRVGFSKLTITIPADMAYIIWNYTGHSSQKSATLDVWYTKGKEPQIDHPLPTYPLADLRQFPKENEKEKLEPLAKSK
jgi:hypothetical protein